MKHTVTLDPNPPSPAVPWLVRTAWGQEWHAVTEAEGIRQATYRPGYARVGDATPQTHPDLFTDEEIRAEIRYLMALNKRHGTHVLRVKAYTALFAVLAKRKGEQR